MCLPIDIFFQNKCSQLKTGSMAASLGFSELLSLFLSPGGREKEGYAG